MSQKRLIHVQSTKEVSTHLRALISARIIPLMNHAANKTWTLTNNANTVAFAFGRKNAVLLTNSRGEKDLLGREEAANRIDTLIANGWSLRVA